MELFNQVCTLEQSVKLNELGVDLLSQLSWCWDGACMTMAGDKAFFLNVDGFNQEWPEAYPAFTVAELGVMLPDGDDVRRERVSQFRSFRIAKSAVGKYGITDGWACSSDYHYVRGVANGFDAYECWKIIDGATEAQARAAMLIYLLENNHITAAEVNQRLQSA